MRLLPPLFSLCLAIGLCQSLLETCADGDEGNCRATASTTQIEVCASGYWQTMPAGAYRCVNGRMVPLIPENPSQLEVMSSQHAGSATSESSSTPSSSRTPQPGDIGYFFCCEEPVPKRDLGDRVASYAEGGMMASVYIASNEAAFRCELEPPADGLYVAVWTRFNPELPSQPMPKNCGEILHLTNPKTGASSHAMVLDRCQSCVGVGHQASDHSTPDNLVNGATIDLSVALWNKLFDGASHEVYDIVYDGLVYGGSNDGPPDKLVNPYCVKQMCPPKKS